jgi:ATP-dependent DNA helicase RecQ
MPESLEAYTQEAGRAGRDGKPSRCVLLFTRSDIANLNRWKRMGEATLPNVRDTYRALKARIGYGTGSISPDELRMAVFGEDSTEQEHGVRMRVSISLLERSGLVSRHLESGQRFRIEIPAPPPGSRALLDSLLEVRRQKEDERVGDMLAYSDGAECRHLMMARHFDQSLERCGDACDRCRGTALSARAVRLGAPTSADVPDVGRVVLEFAASLPFALHRTGYAKALTGAADSPVAPNKCAHHGTLAGCTLKSVRRFADDLIAGGLLSLNRDAEYTLHLTEAGRAALTGEVEILPNPVRSTLSTRPVQSAMGAAIPSAPLEPQLDSNDDDRFERLRAWRRIEALQRKLAPYVIFHDSTLRAIAMTNPTSEDALRNVTGIGPHKLETYGPAVLALLQGNPLTQSEPEIESPIAGY